MDFNTPIFLGFFAAVALLTYCVPRQAKPYLLLVASYVFYMYKPENARLVALLVSVTVVTWCAGVALGSHKLQNVWARRVFLWLALAVALGILFFYKYFDFFGQLAADIGAIFGGSGKFASLDLIAPLGLSYFTFQSLGYVIDVYQHKARPQLNLFKYALFVSFFACIFTGPIERAEHLMPQLENPRPFNYSRMAGGAFRMLWGYFKKMVLADGIGQFVSAVYGGASTAAGPYLVAASLLFSYQIYLDFSGCCDIAIGGARILGIDLLENFNRPFAATSYTELWNRWHMSLTNWFRDYIFTPLAFYNRGLPGVWGKLQGWFNVFIIFPISGLWHGASMGYVIWGVLNGLFLVVGKATAKKRRKLAKNNPLYRIKPVKNFIQRVIVYLLFTFCIVFFAADLYGATAGTVFAGMFHGWNIGLSAFFAGVLDRGLTVRLIAVLIGGCALVELVEWRGPVAEWIRRQWAFIRWPLYYLLALAILFFAAFGQSAFIYQQY